MSKDKDRRCFEFGSGTRRRPIGLDYGEAKDAAFDKLRRVKGGKKKDGHTAHGSGLTARAEVDKIKNDI